MTKPQFTAAYCAQKIISSIPELDYPCPESDLLESLGVDHLRQIIDVMAYRGDGIYETADKNTPSGKKWFGKFLSAYCLKATTNDIATARSLVMLAAVVSPMLPKFIPAVEKRDDSVVDLVSLIETLHSKLLGYWECSPADTTLHWSPRKNYARGAFLYLLSNGVETELPVTIIDDIHIQWIGAAHKSYPKKDALTIIDDWDGISFYFYNHADRDSLRSYNHEMETSEPTLTFFVPLSQEQAKGCKKATGPIKLGGVKVHRGSALVLERMLKPNDIKDLSTMAFFKLAKLLDEDFRSVLAFTAEWTEEENQSILDLALELSETHLSELAGTMTFSASMPRNISSYENMLDALHAARMIPLIATLQGILESDDGNEIMESVAVSNPRVLQHEYTPEMDVIARGRVIQYFVEYERVNGPREVNVDLLQWLGENSDELVQHIQTLVAHGRVDRTLFESVISTSAFGSGVL